MDTFYLFDYITLFFLTFLGGMIPILRQNWKGKYIGLLLLFSASFLLGITALHLIPDSIKSLGIYAGPMVIAGFFLQQIVQRFTHGVEHGHHDKGHNNFGIHSDLFWPVFWGLTVHAFSEGLPLGIAFSDAITLPSLVLAIGIHKIPEAMLVIGLFLHKNNNRTKATLLAVGFAFITPFAAFIARFLGDQYLWVDRLLDWSIPIVAGIFIQISTTIFYENSAQGHSFQWKKWLIIAGGVGVSLLSIL